MLFSRMYLSPSVVHFLYHGPHVFSQPQLDAQVLDSSLSKILQNGDMPKIQVSFSWIVQLQFSVVKSCRYSVRERNS